MQRYNKTICFFNSTIEWGGGEKWHFDMAYAMHKDGYNVLFFASPNSYLNEKLSKTNIKTIPVRISNLSFINPAKIYYVKNKLIENDVDTIIMNQSSDLKAAGIAAKKAKINRIIYRRGSAIPIRDTFFNRYLFKNIVTGIIANTNATKKTILQNNTKLFDNEKIEVIYNGIDIYKLYAQEKKTFYKKTENEFVIGNLGRLEKQKAQHHLLELALELKKRKARPFKIVIAGKGSLEANLKAKCKELNLCDVVVFTGFVNKVKGFYADLDIFILTSIWEGFGYVIAEAMAFKKVVIAFNLSSNPEIIDNNKTGFLVKPGDIEAMADNVIKIMNDKDLQTEMTDKAFHKVKENFTINIAYKKFIKYLHR
ncbi:MAG: hypothetical protein B6I20_11810 [Bacteroidetes bacterium 4572_117]|nr:MAG: hypothetical protein B6I20_11810 [Bacteroidetes bacterium 4572_117]